MAHAQIPPATIRFASDSSVLVSWPEPSAIETNSWVLELFYRLHETASDWAVINLHPAFCSLLIEFDFQKVNVTKLLEHLREQCRKLSFGSFRGGKQVEIPLHYNGADLAEVARITGLSQQDVVRWHSEAEYRVGFLGFSPGFPYMLGLREKLHCPRKKVPRLKVPEGSVAIAGSQTGIYPNEGPGGWQLLGQTEVQLFDPYRQPPTFIQPGDRVKFKALREPRGPATRRDRARIWNGDALMEVLASGFFSTVQDGGRPRLAHLGVSIGGAADPLAFRVGNKLLGNEPDAASIEMTATGVTVRFKKDTWISVCGAECLVRLDDHAMEMWTAIPVLAGQVLSVGEIRGMRAYLCVRGGVEVEPLLGSRSTFVSGAWGGFQGRALREGDVLNVGSEPLNPPLLRSRLLWLARMYDEETQLIRVTRGPQWDWFSDEARQIFFSHTYEVSDEVNRLGIRCIGPNLDYAANRRDVEMLSEGVAAGAVQVPAGGQPMILFCEQCTTGGYPKLANAIRSEAFKLGQLKPGNRIRFQEVTREEAWRINQEFHTNLQTLGLEIG